LIKDTLQNWNWEISTDTKKIGSYNCFKATTTRLVNEYQLKKLKVKKTDDDDETLMFEVPVTAWFTTEIPFGLGPSEYCGLPGLILELSEGNLTTTCEKVELI